MQNIRPIATIDISNIADTMKGVALSVWENAITSPLSGVVRRRIAPLHRLRGYHGNIDEYGGHQCYRYLYKVA